MTDTVHLGLPLIEASQAQKHVTHNEAIVALDAIVQLSVKDSTHTAPPAAVEGDRYKVAGGATGAWASWDLNIALYTQGQWQKLVPQPGWICFDEATGAVTVWRGAPNYWVDIGKSRPPGLFHAVRSTNQSGLAVGFNKLQFETKAVDADGWYDNVGTFRYAPQEPGWYFFYCDAQILYGTAGASKEGIAVAVFKNGAAAVQGGPMLVMTSATIDLGTANCAGLVSMNGSTDYVEFQVYCGVGSGTSSTNGGSLRNFGGGWKVADL
jgi:hypothetical protein